LGFAAVASGALLSIPYGLGVGALPLLAYGAGEAIAALFVPSSKAFREKVDARHRRERREAARAQLVSQIEARATAELPPALRQESARLWDTYRRMNERIRALEDVARRPGASLGAADIERMEDATVTFLGLWMTRLLLHERQASLPDREIAERLTRVDAQLEAASSASERRTLEKAREDLERLLAARKDLRSREASVDAAMLSMADAFEEVFQKIVTRPDAPGAATQLNEAVERMRLEEGLDLALEEELGELYARSDRSASRAASGARATR
jgi:hypothetical protein